MILLSFTGKIRFAAILEILDFLGGVIMKSPDGTSSTVERVIQVYLQLASAKEPTGITDIASSLGVSKAVVHRILQYLVGYDLAERNPATRKYALGSKAFAINAAQRAKDPLYHHALPYMEYLHELTGETVTLCRRYGFHNVYIAQIESRKDIHISVPLGENVPLTIGANGLCQLAYLDKETIDLVLDLPRKKITAATVTDDAEIRARLAKIREDGYSFTSGERVPLCAAIAVPIMSANGIDQQPADTLPIGAISVAFLDSRFPDMSEEHVIAEIKRTAGAIAGKLSAVPSRR